MKIFLFNLTLILLLYSCKEETEKTTSNQTLPVDSCVSLMIDSGLIVFVNTYKVEINTSRLFNNTLFPIKICATIDNEGTGNVDSVIVKYNQSNYKVIPRSLIVLYTETLVQMKKTDDSYIQMKDYNFDSLPDIVIYNSTSGHKNIIEDKFLFCKTKNEYIFNELLSEDANYEIDEKNKEIYSFWESGMASRIYGARTYKWEKDSLKIIKIEIQNYIDSLDLFVKEIKELKDNVWQTKIDTVK